jgi:hypothetical protein
MLSAGARRVIPADAPRSRADQPLPECATRSRADRRLPGCKVRTSSYLIPGLAWAPGWATWLSG